jgi:hypothetical protein
MTPQDRRDVELERDKRRLVAFVDVLHETLDAVLFERPDLFGPHAAALQAAWPAMRKRFDVVKQPLYGRVDRRPLTAKQQEVLDSGLRGHGLTGVELTLKLDVFSDALFTFLDELDRRDAAAEYWKTWAVRLESPEPTGGPLRRMVVRRTRAVLDGARRVLKRGLRQVLGAADMVFESLGDVLSFLPGPKAASAAIREFKDAADVILTERDEAERPARRRGTSAPDGDDTDVSKIDMLRSSATRLR